MSTLTDTKDRLQTYISLKYIAQSYTEISARKLKEIRRDVERNRSFFDELSNLYRAIKVVAAEKYHIFAGKNGKTAIVLITSNFRFYGTLNAKLVEFFVKETASRPADIFVIGKSGAELLKSHSYPTSLTSPTSPTSPTFLTFLTFRKDLPSNEELKPFVAKLAPYKQVLLFYPQFQSILVQNPVVKDITESQNVKQPTPVKRQNLLDAILGKHHTWTDDYMFEPSIEKILEFFDTQMITLLVEEAFLESELAKTAARLVAMDQAQIKAEEFVQTETKALARSIVAVKNAHLLETFISKQERYTP